MNTTKLQSFKARSLLKVSHTVFMVLSFSSWSVAQDRTATGYAWPGGTANLPRTGGGYLSTGFDDPSYFGGLVHLGQDILRPKNSPVYAIGSGVVRSRNISSNPDSCWVWIEHDAFDPANGTGMKVWAVYAHIAVNVRVGDRVSLGQVIGQVMDYNLNGRTSDDHLHFGINKQGWFSSAKTFAADYLKPGGTRSSFSLNIGYGRGGTLPGDWGARKSTNRGMLPTRGFVNPIDFINRYSPFRSILPDGLYRASNESGVHLVRNGVRRVFNTAACFLDWGFDWPQIQVTSPEQIYGVGWEPNIPHLIKSADNGTIYWVVDRILRPISSADIYERMGFSWSDFRVVPQSRINSYPRLESWMTLRKVEPRLVVTDGPFVDYSASSNTFGGGFRVRNLSQGTQRFDVTVRVFRSDGWWNDFPWATGLVLGQNEEAVHWSWRGLPRGHYTYRVLYSYWENGVNMQFYAPSAGRFARPDSRGEFDVQ